MIVAAGVSPSAGSLRGRRRGTPRSDARHLHRRQLHPGQGGISITADVTSPAGQRPAQEHPWAILYQRLAPDARDGSLVVECRGGPFELGVWVDIGELIGRGWAGREVVTA
jgi:hypothetical protein